MTVNDFIHGVVIGASILVVLFYFLLSASLDTNVLIPRDYIEQHICPEDTSFIRFDRDDYSVVCSTLEQDMDCDNGTGVCIE